MKLLITAAGTSQKGTPWVAGASENGGDTVRGVLRSAAAPADRNNKPALPAVGSQVNAFVEHRPARHVDAQGQNPARDYPAITIVYI